MLTFLRRATLVFRFLLALAAAAALLFTFAYPHSILPPNPYADDMEGVTIYTFRSVLWLLPFFVLELICLAGPYRNRVWFSSTLTVLIAGLLAWPVLLAWRPELVHPMLEFEDAKLAVGLGYLSILIFISVLLRLVVLTHLFERPGDWQSGGNVEATVLNPAAARTVREIAANAPKVQPHFLFGSADEGVLERFRLLMGRLWCQTLRRRALLGSALLAGLAWFFLYPQPNKAEAMARDFAAMYETQFSPSPEFAPRATPRAVHAAWRIMKYVHDHESLAGMTLPEAEAWMQLDRAPAAYRRSLRADHTEHIASIDPTFDARTPFLTVTDGRRTAALYIRTNAAKDRINVAEVVDAGWNAVADEHRRIYGNDWKINY